MKKEKASTLRGRLAEERFIALARSLTNKSLVRRVKKASTTLDILGVDVIIFLYSLSGKKDIKVPVQIKSSFTGLRSYQQNHPRHIEAGVICIVVNELIPDEHIIKELSKRLEEIQWNNHEYTDFFARLKYALR